MLIPLDKIEVRKRQRSAMDRTELNALKETIASIGLLHPPVFWYDTTTDTWVLSVGERRLTVMRELHAEKRVFRHDGNEVPLGSVPATRLDEQIDEIGRFEAELDENVRRSDLSWQDRVRAYADLHTMRQQTEPKTYQRGYDAQELVARGAIKAYDGSRQIQRSRSDRQTPRQRKVSKARNQSEAAGLDLQDGRGKDYRRSR
jgi:hypothetical protein